MLFKKLLIMHLKNNWTSKLTENEIKTQLKLPSICLNCFYTFYKSCVSAFCQSNSILSKYYATVTDLFIIEISFCSSRHSLSIIHEVLSLLWYHTVSIIIASLLTMFVTMWIASFWAAKTSIEYWKFQYNNILQSACTFRSSFRN